MRNSPGDTAHCYGCFKPIVRMQSCPDCLSQFCSSGCLNAHKKRCPERLKKLAPAPQFVCPYCGSTEPPRIVQDASAAGVAAGAAAAGLGGCLFGWLAARGANAALAESYRQCSRCGKSLQGLPEEGRPH
jgi:hypothetical protein